MHPLLDRFETNCNARPDRVAAADPGASLDYRTLHAVAAGLSDQIAARTARPHVGILAPSSALGAASFFACWMAGKVPVPLNFMLGPGELERIVRDANLDCALTAEPLARLAQALQLSTVPLEHALHGPVPSVTRNAASPTPTRPAPPARPEDVAVILYTSGTSGDPKGVCLSFNNLVQNAAACIECARVTHDSVFLGVIPQFHTFGLTAMTVVPLLCGATVHYLPRFNPLALANLIAEKRANLVMAVPSMYAAMANLKQARPETFASLTYAISGGEPLPMRVYDAFRERFGVTIYEGYGLTEASPVATLNTPWAHRPGSVGRPIPGVSVAAADSAGNTLPVGQTGELLVRGHSVMLGYHNRPAETATVVRAGALWTGDVGHVDADGYVFITGRAKEMIIVGGENVFPREIENVLLDHPAVAEAAVVGFKDDVRGELPAAFIILREGTTASDAELRAHCRARLAGYKVPRWVRIATDLPRTPTGKIIKKALTPATS